MARRPSSRKEAQASREAQGSGQGARAKRPQSRLSAARAAKWVYAFGGGKAEGGASMKDLLGGKGANLAEMASLGLPVPPGFTITTEACTHYYANDKQLSGGAGGAGRRGLGPRRALTGKTFGDRANPLLVSVRSGARASMPGMMDTVLNLGLNDETVEGLAQLSGDRRFAFDSYRRFIQMYSNVVLDLDHHIFEEILDDHKGSAGYTLDTELTADDWDDVVARYKERVARRDWASRSRRTRTTSSGARSARCSPAG